jgi:hypothetical protein
MRQIVEREICTEIVKSLLRAGFSISVDNGDNNGEDFEIARSHSKTAVLKAMFQTDDEHLYVYNRSPHAAGAFGWVRFVYGNDGWDVLSDYSVNLEKFIGDGTPVQKVVDKYAD